MKGGDVGLAGSGLRKERPQSRSDTATSESTRKGRKDTRGRHAFSSGGMSIEARSDAEDETAAAADDLATLKQQISDVFAGKTDISKVGGCSPA